VDISGRSRAREDVLRGLLASVLSLSLVFAALETTGWWWERRLSQSDLGWTLVASRRMPYDVRGAEGRQFNVLKAGARYTWEGIPVAINAEGFRDREWSTRAQAKRLRILNVGDSVVFGWRVRAEDRYGAQLEAMLNHASGRRRVEVLNAGVPGWSVRTEHDFLVQEGIEYKPDVVVLEFTVVNDVYPGSKSPPRPGLFTFLRDHTYLWPFLTTELRFLLARRRGPEAIPVLNPPLVPEAYFPLDENDPVWDEVWAPIADSVRACRAAGIRPVLVVFPTALQLSSAAHPDVPQRVLRTRAEGLGIDFVDLLPTYRKVCESAGASACEGYENLLFADVWMHPNPYGHRLAAERLARLLEGKPAVASGPDGGSGET